MIISVRIQAWLQFSYMPKLTTIKGDNWKASIAVIWAVLSLVFLRLQSLHLIHLVIQVSCIKLVSLRPFTPTVLETG